MMKKLSVLMIAGFLAWPAVMLADESAADQDPVAVVNSGQPDENTDDSAVITPSAAPVVAATGDIRQPPGLGLVAKTVDTLSQQVTELQNEVIQLQEQTQQTREQISKLLYATYALSGLVVLLALLSLTKSRRQQPVSTRAAAVAAAGGSGTDYDFMASNEAIPAKLDLARAYIAMEDFSAARETLAAVLSGGNPEQCLEAKSLLSKIKY
jgi:FimV-like protein